MVSIGGNIRPYVGDAVIQSVSGKIADIAGNIAAVSLPDGSGVFVGTLGSQTSGSILRGLSGIAVGLPISGRTLYFIGYVSG